MQKCTTKIQAFFLLESFITFFQSLVGLHIYSRTATSGLRYLSTKDGYMFKG